MLIRIGDGKTSGPRSGFRYPDDGADKNSDLVSSENRRGQLNCRAKRCKIENLRVQPFSEFSEFEPIYGQSC